MNKNSEPNAAELNCLDEAVASLALAMGGFPWPETEEGIRELLDDFRTGRKDPASLPEDDEREIALKQLAFNVRRHELLLGEDRKHMAARENSLERKRLKEQAERLAEAVITAKTAWRTACHELSAYDWESRNAMKGDSGEQNRDMENFVSRVLLLARLANS